MVTRIGGARRKTRGIMKKRHRARGKISLRRYLQEFAPGTKVALTIEPAVPEGVFNRRFFGKIGVVQRSQGSCYVVKVRDGGSEKEVIAHPAHLREIHG